MGINLEDKKSYKCNWVFAPNHPKANNNGGVRNYIIIAEKALGKPLPPKTVIHHVDGNSKNDHPSNLVICENNSYHLFLHKRMRSYLATGNPNLYYCAQCKNWKEIKEFPGKRPGWCKPCHSIKQREYKQRR